MNFSKSALFAALTAAALGSTAVTGFTVSGPSTFAVVKSSSSTTKLYQANEPQQQEQEEDIDSDSSSSSNDIQTMSYIENVARFCNQMGYSLDEYEAMVGELQEQHSFLEKRSGTIERLLSGLEWHENTPVDLHDPEAVFKLKTALEMVLEVEVSRNRRKMMIPMCRDDDPSCRRHVVSDDALFLFVMYVHI